MTLLPLSRRGLTVLNWLIVASSLAWLSIAVYLPEVAFPVEVSLGLLAFALLVLRVVHGLRYSRAIDKPRGEDPIGARVESGREWLSILDEQRRVLADHQNFLLDEVASLLAHLSSPLSSPVTARWWFREQLTISVPMEGLDDLALEVPYQTTGFALITVGRVVNDDPDYVLWELDAFPIDQPGEAIVQALRWMEGEILETTNAEGGTKSDGESEEDA